MLHPPDADQDDFPSIIRADTVHSHDIPTAPAKTHLESGATAYGAY